MSAPQSELDLNLENYELFDLLHVFSLPYDFTDYHIRTASKKLDKINEAKLQLPPEVPLFYQKTFVIIECLHKFREQQKLLNERYLSNHNDDGEVLKTVLQINNFENYNNILELLNVVLKNNSNLTKENKKNKRLHNEIQSRLEDVTDISSAAQEPIEKTHNQGINYFDNINKKDKSSIIDTYSNDAVPGQINSLKRIVQMKNLHINSCFRDNYISTNPCDFKYNIPTEIKNVISMKLASIEIPNSWYLYSSLKKNNAFTIKLSTTENLYTFSISVPDGNYDSETLVEYLNNTYFYLNTQPKPDDPKNLLNNISVSVNEYNNKTKFEQIGDTDIDFQFSVYFITESNQNLNDTLGWTLGFRKNEYVDIDDFVESEGLFDAGGDRYIFFCINDYQYNVNETNIICFDETSINENVLAKIPMINGKLCLVVDENDGCSLAKIRRYNGPVNLKRLDIKVMDQFGEIIDLNHMDFSFTLELEILYERNRIV